MEIRGVSVTEGQPAIMGHARYMRYLRRELLDGICTEDIHVLDAARGEACPLLEAAPAAPEVALAIDRNVLVDVGRQRRADQKVLTDGGVDAEAGDGA